MIGQHPSPLATRMLAFGLLVLALPGCGGVGGAGRQETTPTGATITDTVELEESPDVEAAN